MDRSRRHPRWNNSLPYFFVFLLIIVVYSPVLQAGFVWDDDFLVTENMSLRGLSGLREIWLSPGVNIQYYPATFSVFWSQYQLWGNAPLGYHLFNVFLHALNACLLLIVLGRLRLRWSWLMVCVFAIHPVNVESVAWVSELKNLLSGMFALSALSLWLKYFLAENRSVREKEHGGLFSFAAACFLLAVLSKTVTLSLPMVLVILLWWKQVRMKRREISALLVLQTAGLMIAGMTVWLEKHAVGAFGEEWHLSLFDRMIIAGRAVCFYVGKLLWPMDVSFIYPRWAVNALEPGQWLWPGLVLVVLAALWSGRARIGRGPFAAGAIFLITIFPALGFVNFYPMRYSFVADHYQYLAGIPILVLALSCLARLPLWQRPISRSIIVCMILTVLSVLCWVQVGAYHDSKTLYRDVLKKNPAATMAYVNLGNIMLEEGRVRAAQQLYETGLRYDPKADRLRLNLGVAYAHLGDQNSAKKEFTKVLDNERYAAYAHFNLALAAEALNDSASARGHYQQAIQANPFYAAAYRKLAENYVRNGSVAEAIALYEGALAINPTGRDWYLKKASGYPWSDKLNRLRSPYQLLLAAEEIPLRLGRLYEEIGDMVSALEVYTFGLDLNPYDQTLRQKRQKVLTAALSAGLLAEISSP